MLTRQQLQRIAVRERIGLHAQERDYLQHLLLALLYARTADLAFKGGTALRIAYRGGRYSEDLDFNAPADLAALQSLWADVLRDLGHFGIAAEPREVWQTAEGYSFDVSYRGPLYDGRDRTKGKVRVDMSLRGETVDTARELITPEYDDVRPFVVTVLTPAHLVAEKVRALLVRRKPRDAYDLWLMRSKNWPVDWALVERKLAIYELTYSPTGLEAALAEVARDWERDLRPLLPDLPSFDNVRQAVSSYLRGT
jgi:predicted nucleotidyltransferase component of viral defense system